MPLRKRIEGEICSGWREHAVRYKDLQREAEDLVGNDSIQESETVFRFHATFAMEQASEFYDSKVKELQVVFEEVSICVGGVHDVHKDREKCSLVKVNSPCTSIHHLWSLAEEAIPIEGTESEVSAGLRKRYFAIWCLNAREKTSSQKTSLASFVNESFMLTLEENAIKDALREFLPMLVYIDRIRSFALLNCVTIMKLAQRHCNAETSKALIDTLYATPMFQMTAINILQPKIENLARKLQQQLTGTVAELPSSWSMHVCPFCSHTVTNAITLPIGRTCCWKCVAEGCTDAIVYCPLTTKPVDIKELRLERVLVSFLRRFFPSSLKDAPAPLTGNIVDDATENKGAPLVGMLSALRSNNKVTEKCKVSVSRRARRTADEKRPLSLELKNLDVEVSAILKTLATPSTPRKGRISPTIQGKGSPTPTVLPSTETPMLMPLRRRHRRSISCPGTGFCEPPNDMFAHGPPIIVAEQTSTTYVIEPRNLRGFPLCGANCWCIERQAEASACLLSPKA